MSYSSESLSKSSPILLVTISSSDDDCFSLLEELFEFRDSIDELSEFFDFACPLIEVALSESLSSSGCLEIYCNRVIEADRLRSIELSCPSLLKDIVWKFWSCLGKMCCNGELNCIIKRFKF